MKLITKHVGTALLGLIVCLGCWLMLWPAAAADLALGVDLAPGPSRAALPEAWVPISLLRMTGVFIALASAAIISASTRTAASRVGFAWVAGFGLVVTLIQWRATLPFEVGLAATLVVGSLGCLGSASSGQSESRST